MQQGSSSAFPVRDWYMILSFWMAVASGRIPDVGYESNLDKELIVSLKPDLLMAYGVGASSAEYLRKLAEMGVKVMYNADYLEEHPLARCEWIKVFGLLTGREAKS